MAIYVDNFGFETSVWNPWTGRHVTSKWYHLVSDQLDPTELHEFIDQLGLKREYFQRGVDKNTGVYNPGHDHYDVTLNKRRLAVRFGATQIDIHQLGRIIIAKNKLWHQLVDQRAEELRKEQHGT